MNNNSGPGVNIKRIDDRSRHRVLQLIYPHNGEFRIRQIDLGNREDYKLSSRQNRYGKQPS